MNTGQRSARLRAVAADYLALLVVLGVLVVVFGMSTRYFFTPTTFRTIANQIPAAVIVAAGMTFVLILAGIDLSVGGILALSGAVLGVSLVRFGLPLPAAVLACCVCGLFCGAMNGFVVARWRIPSFIVTLGMMEISRGAAYLVTDSQTMYIGKSVQGLSEVGFAGLSVPFMAAFLIVVAGQWMLARSTFGRYVIATGSNEEAARLSGVNTAMVKVQVFALSGLLCGIAAVIYCSRLASADPNAGLGLELQAIAAVVIGGTSLMGGRGSLVSSFFGVLVIAVLNAGLAQIGAQEPVKRLITGCVIVAAVIADHYRSRKKLA